MALSLRYLVILYITAELSLTLANLISGLCIDVVILVIVFGIVKVKSNNESV